MEQKKKKVDEKAPESQSVQELSIVQEHFETHLTIGEISFKCYDFPINALCGLAIELLKNPDIQKYLKILEEKKPSPSYAE